MTASLARLTAALADRYRIERELGQGGMATVYLATEVKHDCQVALKVLRAELAQALGHDRFLREIKIAVQLHASDMPTLQHCPRQTGPLATRPKDRTPSRVDA